MSIQNPVIFYIQKEAQAVRTDPEGIVYLLIRKSVLFKKHMHIWIWVAFATQVVPRLHSGNHWYIQLFLTGLNCSHLEAKEMPTGTSPSN